MGHWLFKTEPSEFSYDDLVKKGRATWDGVTNALALKHLRSCKKGDEVLIYHTGSERAVVGIGKLVSDPYSDPNRQDPKLVVVDVAPVQRLHAPVTLEQIKADPALGRWELVRLPRLSVMPVPTEIWPRILKLQT